MRKKRWSSYKGPDGILILELKVTVYSNVYIYRSLLDRLNLKDKRYVPYVKGKLERKIRAYMEKIEVLPSNTEYIEGVYPPRVPMLELKRLNMTENGRISGLGLQARK